MRTLVENAKEFVFGGNAIFTLHSKNTDRHFTYKIKRSKDKEELYFIYLLRGPDNTTDYTYIGCYYTDNNYFHVANDWRCQNVRNWPRSMQALKYFLDNIDNLNPLCEVFHEGKCCRCGRRLTTPESIKKGVGPECMRRI
jgi:hypothetical protein